MLLGAQVALLFSALAAYGVAAATLRPVEETRARAATIPAAEPDSRLPVPSTRDEVGRLGRTLNEMLGRLGEALEHEGSFVADASHELRTPLAILKTELELALAEGRNIEELREPVSSAAEETDRLTQLSENLLTIAQTERGELSLRRSPVELREVLEGIARRFAHRAATEGRTIDVDGPALQIRADRLRLDRRSAASSTTHCATGAALSLWPWSRAMAWSRSTSATRAVVSHSSFLAAPSSASLAPPPAAVTAAAALGFRRSHCRPLPRRRGTRRKLGRGGGRLDDGTVRPRRVCGPLTKPLAAASTIGELMPPASLRADLETALAVID